MPPLTQTLPQAPAQQIPAEAQIIVQSGDLEGARWSDLRSDMVSTITGIASKLGFTMIPNEQLLEMGFPVEDESRFDDGTLDLDFEESSIEALIKMQKDGLKFAETCGRFAHNLQIRNHEPLQTDNQADQVDGQ